MTKAELVDHVAAAVQLPKSQTDAVLTQCLQATMDTLQAGEAVDVPHGRSLGGVRAGSNDVGDAHDPRKLPVRRREIPDHWVAVPSAKLSLLDVPQSPRSRVSKPRKRKSSGVRVGAGRRPCYLLRILPGKS